MTFLTAQFQALFDAAISSKPHQSFRQQFLSKSEYLLQFKTYAMQVPRQTGKTSFITNVMKAGDILITCSEEMKRHTIRMYNIHQDQIYVSGCFNYMRPQQPRCGKPARFVFFDEVEPNKQDLSLMVESGLIDDDTIVFGLYTYIPKRLMKTEYKCHYGVWV